MSQHTYPVMKDALTEAARVADEINHPVQVMEKDSRFCVASTVNEAMQLMEQHWFREATIYPTRPRPLVYYDEKREEQIADAVQALIDIALEVHYDRSSDDRFQSCHMCGSWEEHQDGCPMPRLERWLDGERWSPKG